MEGARWRADLEPWSQVQRLRLREVLHVCAHGLLLALDVLHEFFEAVEAGLHLVERVIHGLDLAGDLIDLAVLCSCWAFISCCRVSML